MTGGKPWTLEEESTLRGSLKDHVSLEVVAGHVGNTKEAVRQKMIGLGLKELERRKTGCCSSDLRLPEELPSVEEALKTLSAALKVLEQPGLGQAEDGVVFYASYRSIALRRLMS